ncbi:hypothetical protein AMAG_07998 [Allomyces macrogynus ATCC 38327]|uniref:Uncharacterized protein n=1 Tax=Allomyces macrogynus (strain ATCC 38327) TaxID=578462 RepID=A0A0L0SK12_ALLM3|nr:hypothetical protein AMAG_07998 [Allomyces macrogynus ATCC 38327]|eukprot:KNE62822.1 hypothetical protein AMAG_07998 [Allomyces macrogynus ATCC 38327]
MSGVGNINTVKFITTLTPFKMPASSLWRCNLEFNLREIRPVLDARLDRSNGQVRFTMSWLIRNRVPRVARRAPTHVHDQQLLTARSHFIAPPRLIYLLLNLPRNITLDLLLPILFARGVHGVLDLVGPVPGLPDKTSQMAYLSLSPTSRNDGRALVDASIDGHQLQVCTISDPAKFFASTHDLRAVIQRYVERLD